MDGRCGAPLGTTDAPSGNMTPGNPTSAIAAGGGEKSSADAKAAAEMPKLEYMGPAGDEFNNPRKRTNFLRTLADQAIANPLDLSAYFPTGQPTQQIPVPHQTAQKKAKSSFSIDNLLAVVSQKTNQSQESVECPLPNKKMCTPSNSVPSTAPYRVNQNLIKSTCSYSLPKVPSPSVFEFPEDFLEPPKTSAPARNESSEPPKQQMGEGAKSDLHTNNSPPKPSGAFLGGEKGQKPINTNPVQQIAPTPAHGAEKTISTAPTVPQSRAPKPSGAQVKNVVPDSSHISTNLGSQQVIRNQFGAIQHPARGTIGPNVQPVRHRIVTSSQKGRGPIVVTQPGSRNLSAPPAVRNQATPAQRAPIVMAAPSVRNSSGMVRQPCNKAQHVTQAIRGPIVSSTLHSNSTVPTASLNPSIRTLIPVTSQYVSNSASHTAMNGPMASSVSPMRTPIVLTGVSNNPISQPSRNQTEPPPLPVRYQVSPIIRPVRNQLAAPLVNQNIRYNATIAQQSVPNQSINAQQINNVSSFQHHSQESYRSAPQGNIAPIGTAHQNPPAQINSAPRQIVVQRMSNAVVYVPTQTASSAKNNQTVIEPQIRPTHSQVVPVSPVRQSKPQFKVPSPIDRQKVQQIKQSRQLAIARRAEKESRKSVDNQPVSIKAAEPVIDLTNDTDNKPNAKKEDDLNEFAVNIIFSALVSENPTETMQSNKSLYTLVKDHVAMQDKLVVEPGQVTQPIGGPVGTETAATNTGEDTRYVAADLRRLAREITAEDQSSQQTRAAPEGMTGHVTPGAAPINAVPAVQAPIETAEEDLDIIIIEPPYPPATVKPPVVTQRNNRKKRVRAPRKPRNTKNLRQQEDARTIANVIRQSNPLWNGGDQMKKTDSSGETIESTSSSSGSAPHSRNSPHRPAAVETVPTAAPPVTPTPSMGTRRSVRIKDNFAKQQDLIYQSVIAASLQTPEKPPPPVKKLKCEEEKEEKVPVKRAPRVRKPKVVREKATPSREVTVARTRKAETSATDAPKKRRFHSRVDYNRHYYEVLSTNLLKNVLSPTHPDKFNITDHFTYPVLRRAIVNRNTLCYAISMLQVMMRVPQVYYIVRSHTHLPEEKTLGCFLCLLQTTINIKPTYDDYPTFISIMREVWSGVQVDQMHCVMEAMQHFLDRFDEDFIREHPVGETGPHLPVRNGFEIHMVNDYKCTTCDHIFPVKDKAVYLSIDLSRKNSGTMHTMQGLVDNFYKPAPAHGFECAFCEGDRFTCTTRFTKLPEVLLYFIPRVRTRRSEKDMTVVEVQKTLTVRENDTEQKYALCAFVTHHGDSGRNGHYKAFEIDNTLPGKPYNEFDDAKVILDAALTWDMTVVVAMFRKETSVAKDAPTDIIFDGRGNIAYANEKYVTAAEADYRRH